MAVLGPGNVQPTVNEIDLLPPEAAKLGSPQAMPEGEQDHGRVPMTVAVAVAWSRERSYLDSHPYEHGDPAEITLAA
jgi:hypothetical protein